MKLETYTNETRIHFRKKKDPNHATVSVTFPEAPDWFLFVGRDGHVTWYNEVTEQLYTLATPDSTIYNQ